MFCSNCGKKVIDGANYCGNCGHKIVCSEEGALPAMPGFSEPPKPPIPPTLPSKPIQLEKEAVGKNDDEKKESTESSMERLSNDKKAKALIKSKLIVDEQSGRLVAIKPEETKKQQPKKSGCGCLVAIVLVFLVCLSINNVISQVNKKKENTEVSENVPKIAEHAFVDFSETELECIKFKYPEFEQEHAKQLIGKAALIVSNSPFCNQVTRAHIAEESYTGDKVLYAVDCANGKRVLLSEQEINAQVQLEQERFQPKPYMAVIRPQAIKRISPEEYAEISSINQSVQSETTLLLMMHKAAIMVAKCQLCKEVLGVNIEKLDCIADKLVFYVDCQNEQRVYLTDAEINENVSIGEERFAKKPAPISKDAFWYYPETKSELKKAGYTKSLKKYGLDYLKRSNKLLLPAARKAARNSHCDQVDTVMLSDKSTKNKMIIMVRAKNLNVFYMTVEDITNDKPAVCEREKLEPLLLRHSVIAEEVIKSKLRYPSTYSQCFFGNNFETHPKFNEITVTFTAKNGFNLELTYVAVVQFNADSEVVGFHMQEKR